MISKIWNCLEKFFAALGNKAMAEQENRAFLLRSLLSHKRRSGRRLRIRTATRLGRAARPPGADRTPICTSNKRIDRVTEK
jgi:hypothetical protein